MALFYEIPNDLFSFPSFYQPRRSVYRRPALPTVLAYPSFEVYEKPRQQHVLIKKRHSGELKLQEDGENGWSAQVELPGVKSIKNVDLELHDKTLFVRSKSKGDYQTVLSNYTLQVPEGVDERQIKGVLSNGVLKISLPKLKPVEEEKPKEPTSNTLSNKLEIPSNNIFSIWQRCLQGPKETTEDNETHRITRLEFPEGFNKEHLDIEFNKGVLTVTAHKKDDHSTFSFKRSIALPKNLTENDISAKFEGRTLEIQYPKETPSNEKASFKIQIAAEPEKENESSETAVTSPERPEEHLEESPESKQENEEEKSEAQPQKEEHSNEHNDAAADFEIVSEEEEEVVTV